MVALLAFERGDVAPALAASWHIAERVWRWPLAEGANDRRRVYRCGFAQKQGPYEEAFHELFAALDKAEGILAQSRYLAGATLTFMDVRLFMTLIRFDPVRCLRYQHAFMPLPGVRL